MKYAPLLWPSNKINIVIQTGKERAKPMAALLPPDDSAGSRHRKEFPRGVVSWKLISRGDPLLFEKIGGGSTMYQEGCYI